MIPTFIAPVEPPAEPRVIEAGRLLFGRIKSMAQHGERYRVVERPEEAQLILLIASFTLFFSHLDRARVSVRRHPLRLRYPQKCFVYDIDDHPSPFIPGVFASLDSRFHDGSGQMAGPYVHHLGNSQLEPRKPVEEAPSLFSFVGAVTHGVRDRVVRLNHSRGHVVQTDARWPDGRAERDAFKRQYVNSIHDSQFVLCPRGRGTASVRLFEVIQAGRVPVIISDHWIAPAGPPWDEFSIRVPERSVETIPSLLEQLEPQAARMGAAARRAFDEWFSERSAMGRILDSCVEIQSRQSSWTVERAWRRGRYLSQPTSIRRFMVGPVADWLRAKHVLQRPQPRHERNA